MNDLSIDPNEESSTTGAARTLYPHLWDLGWLRSRARAIRAAWDRIENALPKAQTGGQAPTDVLRAAVEDSLSAPHRLRSLLSVLEEQSRLASIRYRFEHGIGYEGLNTEERRRKLLSELGWERAANRHAGPHLAVLEDLAEIASEAHWIDSDDPKRDTFVVLMDHEAAAAGHDAREQRVSVPLDRDGALEVLAKRYGWPRDRNTRKRRLDTAREWAEGQIAKDPASSESRRLAEALEAIQRWFGAPQK